MIFLKTFFMNLKIFSEKINGTKNTDVNGTYSEKYQKY